MENILYHYTSGNGLMGILNSSELHCSHILFLNDPTEHKYFDNVLEELFINSEDCKEIYSNLYNESYYGITYEFHEYYVLSFSKNKDSLSMWNYYSNSNGYNLGFDIESIINRNNTTNKSFFKIELVYDKTKQYNLLKKYIKSFKKELIRLRRLNIDSDEYNHAEELLIRKFNDGLIMYRFTFKHSGYSREEEVRILIAKPVNNGEESSYRISPNGVIVEYIKLKIDIKEDLKTITIHPLGSDLHLAGINGFLYSIQTNDTLKVNISKVPFRNV